MELGDCPNKITKLSRILDDNNRRKAWGNPAAMAEKFKRLLRQEFLEPGDVIGVARKKALRVYDHYAVYIGDGRVIHYAGTGNDFSGEITIHEADMKEFLKDDLFNNCEHFAIWSKTNISESYQVKNKMKYLSVFLRMPVWHYV